MKEAWLNILMQDVVHAVEQSHTGKNDSCGMFFLLSDDPHQDLELILITPLT
jgi:hypothetical protein